jgi:predicted ArsR family transcriptional regulator
MLKQLLRELEENDRMQTLQDLADTLGVSPPLIEDMIHRLAQQGYLTEAEQCSDGCGVCPLKSACGARQQATRFWTLTTKAERLLSS